MSPLYGPIQSYTLRTGRQLPTKDCHLRQHSDQSNGQDASARFMRFMRSKSKGLLRISSELFEGSTTAGAGCVQ